VQFHPVRLACITAYSQQLPKREILFLREPFKIERLGDRDYMQISDHLHYLMQHVGADGKFDHNEGAWPIAKDRVSRAVDVLNNYCDNLPSLPTVLANLSLDIANDLGKLVDRTRQRFVTSRAFGAGAVAVGALEQAVDLWKEVFGQEPEGLRERTDEAKQALLMVERQESWSRLN
jgi:hypothetical protein